MSKLAPYLRGVLKRVSKSLELRYRRSGPRNAILAIKSRKLTDRIAFQAKRYVIFLVPGLNIVNGGQMSICSIASETQKLLAKNGVVTAVCTAFYEPRILRYTKFDNDIDILAFADLLPRFPHGSDILVHIPELFVQEFVTDCTFVYRSRPDLNWRFNILLQNINLTPSKEAVDVLQQLGPTTATIAHQASAAAAQRLGCPVHYLSWKLCPEDFERVEYSSKKKLIVVSPDKHSEKLEIVRRISESLPDHKIVRIWNMTYRKYKSVIKDAKFMFTFGEGLDGYFVESIFSGAIAMAIFNERFFPSEYGNLEGVFPDSEHAISDIGEFLKAADRETHYKAIADRQYSLAAKTFVREEYLQNIRAFYEQCCPEWKFSQ
jgi:hypothetical protein